MEKATIFLWTIGIQVLYFSLIWQTLACGTVHAGRKGLPSDIMNIKDKELKSMKRCNVYPDRKADLLLPHGTQQVCSLVDNNDGHHWVFKSNTGSQRERKVGAQRSSEASYYGIIQQIHGRGGSSWAELEATNAALKASLVYEAPLLFVGSCISFRKKESTSQPPRNTKGSMDVSFLLWTYQQASRGTCLPEKAAQQSILTKWRKVQTLTGHFSVLLPTRYPCSTLILNMHVLFATLECVLHPIFRRFTPWKTTVIIKTILMQTKKNKG